MSGSKLPFVQKLRSRSSNKDLRRQIVSATSMRSVDMPTSISGGCLSVLPIFDTVDPVDFEECVAQGKTRSNDTASYANWNVRQFADFPSDDVELKITPRASLYKDTQIPFNGIDLPPDINDILAAYSSDFVVINRKYDHYSTGDIYGNRVAENAAIVQNLPTQIFEVDLEECLDNSPSQRCSLSSLKSVDSAPSAQHDLQPGFNVEPLVSLAELTQSIVDPVIPGILENMPTDQMDAINATKREKNRHTQIFNVYPIQNETEIIEKRRIPAVPYEWKGHRLFLKLISLKMDLEIEPIFASAALYDAKERKKISENFYFDFNSDAIKGLLRGHVPYQDVSSLSKSTIFSVSHPSNDLFLVFRFSRNFVKLEKVLQAGELPEITESYLKDDKNKEKLKIQCLEFCDRLGAYRMPFAWAAIDLSKIVAEAASCMLENSDQLKPDAETYHSGSSMLENTFLSDNDSTNSAETADRRSSNGNTSTLKRGDDSQGFVRNNSQRKSSNKSLKHLFDDIDKFKPLTLTVNNFFRQESDKLNDDDLFKYLTEIRKNTLLGKKLKCIPGTLKFDISPYADECLNCLSPELLRIAPFQDDDFNITKESLEFPAKEIYVPNYSQRNLLYLFPKSVNFASKPGSARNIALKVQLMDGLKEIPQVFFGKSSCPAKLNANYSIVNYHNKIPQFYDEIKIQLPLHLTDAFHLLFTFFHVHCKVKADGQTGNLETPIGFAWLPLCPKNGELPGGDFNLPVSLDPLPDCYFYLPPDVNLPNVKYLDNHKAAFGFSVTPVTTVYTQDKFLDAFFKAYHLLKCYDKMQTSVDLNENDLRQIIRNLIKARPEPLVKFLYVVLDKLVDFLICPPVVGGVVLNVGLTCFEILGQITKILTFLVDGFSDQHNRSTLLTSYIQYFNVSHCGDSECSPTNRTSHRVYSSENSSDNSELMEIIRGFEKSSFLRLSVNQTPKKVLHEELATQWLESTGQSRDMACGNAWFFFELMIKSMGEYLLVPKPSKIYLKRKLRFSPHFIADVTTLVTTLTSEMIGRCGKDDRFVKNLNFGLAFFMRDALSLMDRSFVLGLVKSYCTKISAKLATAIDPDALLLLKLDCLRIVCSHEHYVTLNLPFAPVGLLPGTATPSSYGSGTPSTGNAATVHGSATGFHGSGALTAGAYGSASATMQRQKPPSPSPSQSSRSSCGSATASSSSTTNGSAATGVGLGRARLCADFRSRHFLTGLLLSDLYHALECKSGAASAKSIDIVRGLLSAHDVDQRLSDKFVKAKVAELYFPLLGIVMEAVGQLFDPCAQKFKPTACPGLNFDEIYPNNSTPIVLVNSNSNLSHGVINGPPTSLSLEDTRNLLVSFCWVLKNVDSASLRHWLAELSHLRLNQLLDVLQLCVSCFEYRGRGQGRTTATNQSRVPLNEMESVILGVNSARKSFSLRTVNKAEFSDNPPSSDGVRWRKGCQYPDLKAKRHENFFWDDPLLEANLSTEINTIILDVLEMLVKNGTGSSPASRQGGLTNGGESAINATIAEPVVRVLLHMLSTSQSIQAGQNLFATQRSMVCKFSEFLFEDDTDQCSNLCLQLLRHCASRLQPTRAQASASLYHLLRNAYDSGSNFSRVKMQITVSLSSLVGTLAGSPAHPHSSTHRRLFTDWFDESNLRRSLKRILSYAEADSSNDFSKSANFGEQVKDLVFNLHMILSDTVKMKEFQNDFEMLIDLMYRIAKGYQNSPDLRLTWLQSMAQKQLDRGHYAEAAQCYVHAAALTAEYLRMLEPGADHLPEGAVSFLPLSDDVLEESAVGDDVVRPRDDEGRLLRDAVRRPGRTRICVPRTVHHKTSRNFPTNGIFYIEKFGGDPKLVEVVKDSNNVDRTVLDPRKSYLQITYVEPFFDAWELRRRTSLFERNFNVRRFVYFTPFTAHGAPRGDLREQFKRRTVLTAAHCLPYVATRVRVVQREQLVCAPIEVAIEDVRRKTLELDAASRREPRDAKMLQMVLQGCIGTTVNQGPLEIANVFLSPSADCGDVTDGSSTDFGGHRPGHGFDFTDPTANCALRNKLRLAFKDFSKKCADALRENKRLMGSERREYQKELERNYVQFTERLGPILVASRMHSRGGFAVAAAVPSVAREQSNENDDEELAEDGVEFMSTV